MSSKPSCPLQRELEAISCPLQHVGLRNGMAGGLCAKCGAVMDPKLSHQTSVGTVCQSCALQDATFDAELAALELEEDGSFWLGFCAGLFGNMLGLAFVYQQGGRDTKRGAAWGIGAAMALVALLFIGMSLSTGRG